MLSTCKFIVQLIIENAIKSMSQIESLAKRTEDQPLLKEMKGKINTLEKVLEYLQTI
jgi:hypothetical protein